MKTRSTFLPLSNSRGYDMYLPLANLTRHLVRLLCRHSNWQHPSLPLQRRNNERDGFSNHRRLGCLLIRLCMNWPKKTPKIRVSGLCKGNSPVTGWFPHKGTVTRKSFHLITSPWAKLPMKMINFHGVFGLFEPFIVGGEFQFWHIYFIALLIDIWYSPYDLSSSMWFIYDILSDYNKLMVTGCTPFNILRPRQNCRHFP